MCSTHFDFYGVCKLLAHATHPDDCLKATKTINLRKSNLLPVIVRTVWIDTYD